MNRNQWVTRSRCFVILLWGVMLETSIAFGQEPKAQYGLPTTSSDVSQSPAANSQPPQWAQEYLAKDPLASKNEITLNDIQKGVADEKQQAFIIDRYFDRVSGMSEEDKRSFLKDMMERGSPQLQRQASRALTRRGELEEIVKERLTSWLQEENSEARQAAMVGLEHIETGSAGLPEAYWSALWEGLSSQDEKVQASVAHRILEEGASAVPGLLKVMQEGTPTARIRAATLLSRIVGSRTLPADGAFEKPPTPRMTPMEMDRGASEEPKRKGEIAKPGHQSRWIDEAKPKVVQVYFGTNREMTPAEQPPWSRVLFYPMVAIGMVLACVWSLWPGKSNHKMGCLGISVVAIFLCGSIWALVLFRSELLDRWRIGTGPRFGGRRDSSNQMYYGICNVSIPPTHKIGEVESPTLGPEDEQEHVVLQKTETLEADAYFAAIRNRLSTLPKDDRSCFVFIHGFNVTFENAAKRTAQIYYDLQFEGVPIFFSWPSRASIRHYFSDRNEIEFSRYMIKQFLIDVAQRSKADRIHVIAHSMGADATCRAIAELGDQGRIFDQIILAAPDIDRDVFRTQLAPRLIRTANRTTLYCSKNDWALLASKTFNDSPRAGDSSQGALVTVGVDTVDASDIDTDLLGHSYYGDCMPILRDVQQLILKDLPPEERRLKPWPVDNDLRYWTLILEELQKRLPPVPSGVIQQETPEVR